MADLIAIEEARRRVLAARGRLPPERCRSTAPSGACSPRTCRAAWTCRPSPARPWTATRWRPGPPASCPWSASRAPAARSRGPAEPGAAVRISTGAEVPAGADAVVPVERSEPARRRCACRNARRARTCAMRARTCAPADLCCAPAPRSGPAEVAVAASLGRAELSVRRRPRVALLVTGDELAEPGEPLGPGQIYSSNGWALAGQAARRRRGGGVARDRARRRRGHARRARARPRRRRRGVRLGRSVGRPARPREGAAGGARRGASASGA